MKAKSKIPTKTFEFRHWRKAFDTYRKTETVYGNNMQLVISTHPYTSGYWIEEKCKKLTKGDICYTGDEVYALERRIINEIATANKEFRGAKLTF